MDDLGCRTACAFVQFAFGAVLLAAAPRLGNAQTNDFIRKTNPLATPRAFGGCAVMGDYIYYFGGAKGDGITVKNDIATNSVLKARVMPDGTLGAWEETTPLPETRHYIENSTLVLNDVVYIVGGSTQSANGTRLNTAIFSRPLQNGTLLPWAVSEPFGEGLSTITAVTTPGHLHIVGGNRKENTPSNQVWSNSIYADGSMGSWSQGPTLPTTLWYHSAGVASGRVYVWGGLPASDPKQVSSTIYSAPILGSGALGDWRQEPVSLPQPFYGASSAVAGNYLLSFSPRYAKGTQASGTNGNDVWYAVVTPAGLSQWRMKQTFLPNKQYHAAGPDYHRGMIFFGGGRPGFLKPMLSDFSVFQLGPSARDSAEQTWLAHQRAHQNTVAAFSPSLTGQSTLAYLAASTLSSSAVPGFKTYASARDETAATGKPLVLYFTRADAQPCIEQRHALGDPGFAQCAAAASIAWLETSDNHQLAQQLGVYRVPTWIFYDKRGNEVEQARRVGAISVAELASTIQSLR